jgi:hypothetical protein
MIFKKITNYELPEEGSHLAVLADNEDLGEKTTPWGLKKQVRFKWLLQQKGKDGRELSVIATFNNSLNENSSLVEAITSITGTPPGEEFDGDTMIGTNSRLTLKHKTKKDGNIFPKIVAILRPTKGDPVLRVPGWFKRADSGGKNPPAAATPSEAAPQPVPKPSTAASSDGNRNDHLESPPEPPDCDPSDYDEAASFQAGEHAA